MSPAVVLRSAPAAFAVPAPLRQHRVATLHQPRFCRSPARGRTCGPCPGRPRCGCPAQHDRLRRRALDGDGGRRAWRPPDAILPKREAAACTARKSSCRRLQPIQNQMICRHAACEKRKAVWAFAIKTAFCLCGFASGRGSIPGNPATWISGSKLFWVVNNLCISILCESCAATARAPGLQPLAAAPRRGLSAGGLCRACAIKLFQLLSKQLIFEDGKAAPPPGPRRSQP